MSIFQLKYWGWNKKCRENWPFFQYSEIEIYLFITKAHPFNVQVRYSGRPSFPGNFVFSNNACLFFFLFFLFFFFHFGLFKCGPPRNARYIVLNCNSVWILNLVIWCTHTTINWVKCVANVCLRICAKCCYFRVRRENRFESAIGKAIKT